MTIVWFWVRNNDDEGQDIRYDSLYILSPVKLSDKAHELAPVVEIFGQDASL